MDDGPPERPARGCEVAEHQARSLGRRRRPRQRRRRSAGAAARRPVGQRQQQPDDDGVRQQRRAAVADERQRDAGQREELEVAGRDDERLDADDEGEAGREDRPEVVGGRGADPQPALDDDEVQAEDREHADQPELLAEGREREVGVDRGDRQPAADHRQAVAQPRPDQAAARERVERLDDLVARAERVGERVEPDVDARRGRARTARP